jgi:benzoyl-CoA reductase/2-hydroxyglutaryl-CoA dehydratase subunit BcrC/BadD/HgdB
MKEIGITTTIPTEVLLAAGYRPIDLNNVFISDADPGHFVAIAERDGFPLNCCTWIKGIYGVCLEEKIGSVICVTSGDCSNTIMLMEVLQLKGLKAIPFAYPQKPDMEQMETSLSSLARSLGTTLEAANSIRLELESVRHLAHELDRLTWEEDLVSGWENHYWLVSTSDFNGNQKHYRNQLGEQITRSYQRHPYPEDSLRLAYIGVPAVFGRHLYGYLEENKARVVFNEVQRQFAMLCPGKNLAEQYSNYTYPYSINRRIEDITAEIEKRHIDAVIHYVQAFCHRGIGDILLRQALKVPILTLEGNNNYFLCQHLKTRIEAFLDILHHRKGKRKYDNIKCGTTPSRNKT